MDTSNEAVSFALPESMHSIYKFNSLIDEVTRINNITGPYYMQELLKAIEESSKFYAGAIMSYEKSVVRSKATKAVLTLDEAPAQLAAKGLKVTADNVAAFSESSALYISAKDTEAYYSALSVYLKQQIEKFQRAHDDARRIFESYRQPYGTTTALPSGEDRN